MAQTISRPQTYWNGNGKFQIAADMLRQEIPVMGPVLDKKRPKLERYRKAVNAYYDLYNNSGWNRPQAIRGMFKVSAKEMIGWIRAAEMSTPGDNYTRRRAFEMVAKVEAIMDEVIKEALEEAGY